MSDAPRSVVFSFSAGFRTAKRLPHLHSLRCAGKYGVSSKTSGTRLKQLVKLSKRKEELLAEVQDIDRAMVRLEQEFRETRRQKNKKAKLTISRETSGSGRKQQTLSKGVPGR